MNATSRTHLWQRLQEAGLVAGDPPFAPASPWFVRLMLGIAGWIGALFILGFIGTGFAMVMRNAGSAAFAAILCCGGAYALFRLPSKGDFTSQFGLATGLAGQALFAIAISQHFSTDKSVGFFLFFCVEAALTLLMPNFMHRIFSTLGAVGAASFGLAQAGLHGVALPLTAAGCALVWRGEMRLAARADLWQPVGYGLALGVLQTATTSLMGREMLSLFGRDKGGWLLKHGAEVGTSLVIIVVLVVTVNILRELVIEPFSSEGIAILGCAVLTLAVSFPAHGFAAALLILILGFAGGNRILFGLGLLALVSFLSHYYYQMRETLLFKSLILAAIGLFMIGCRWLLLKLYPAKETRIHA
ncbi:MAG: DUF4401 domain-containing protein [Deltaproteobacteria bacterium]|nr:DUF4401 domain-containing protein [Deltaproteobacteria bacterium]